MTRACHLAVVGGSGSGKTWLAARLATHFAPGAGCVSLDSFYRDLSDMELEHRERVNFDEPSAIDWEAVRGFLEALDKEGRARVPNYDFATHARQPGGAVCELKPVMIWDGLWLLGPEWLRERYCWSVFVECEVEERLRRRIERDRVERGRSEASVRRQFDLMVNPMHEAHVAPQGALATVKVLSPPDEVEWARVVAMAERRVLEWFGGAAVWRGGSR